MILIILLLGALLSSPFWPNLVKEDTANSCFWKKDGSRISTAVGSTPDQIKTTIVSNLELDEYMKRAKEQNKCVSNSGLVGYLFNLLKVK